MVFDKAQAMAQLMIVWATTRSGRPTPLSIQGYECIPMC